MELEAKSRYIRQAELVQRIVDLHVPHSVGRVAQPPVLDVGAEFQRITFADRLAVLVLATFVVEFDALVLVREA